MIDDIRRNFTMNNQTGLRIRPFRQSHLNRHKDKELIYLSKYLKYIAKKDLDFTTLNHKKWEHFITKAADADKVLRDDEVSLLPRADNGASSSSSSEQNEHNPETS